MYDDNFVIIFFTNIHFIFAIYSGRGNKKEQELAPYEKRKKTRSPDTQMISLECIYSEEFNLEIHSIDISTIGPLCTCVLVSVEV